MDLTTHSEYGAIRFKAITASNPMDSDLPVKILSRTVDNLGSALDRIAGDAISIP